MSITRGIFEKSLRTRGANSETIVVCGTGSLAPFHYDCGAHCATVVPTARVGQVTGQGGANPAAPKRSGVEKPTATKRRRGSRAQPSEAVQGAT